MKRRLLRTMKLASVLVLLLGSSFLLPNADANSGSLPPGTYSTTVVEADVPPEFPPEFIPILVGYWETEFTEDGNTIITKDGEIVATGRYLSSKNRFVMTDLAGSLACTDAPGIATGIYNWDFENGDLVLSPVNDRCLGRLFVLTLHPMQPE